MEKKRSMNGSPACRFPDGFRILKGTQEYVTYIEHSSVRIWASDVAAHYDNHTHSAIEIIMPHRGTSTYHLSNDFYCVQPGEILIIPSGCPHALTEPAETYRHLFLFEPNPLLTLLDLPSIAHMMQQPIYLQEDTKLRQQVTQLLMDAVACYDKREPLWNTLCYSYLMQMYALLGRDYLQTSALSVQTEQPGMDLPILGSAITYINEHYMDDITLEDVAAFAGFSKCYFSRTFKSYIGVSFTAFLTRKRLSAAVDLLMHTDLSVQNVAAKSGFGSTTTFNRVFRESKSCSPTQFRSIYGIALPHKAGPPDFANDPPPADGDAGAATATDG